jgi:hypothetical protein
VTVFNAFSYQPDKDDHSIDGTCHQILAKLLQAKKPKVIIHCHNSDYSDEFMKRFNFRNSVYRLKREIIKITDDHEAVVIPSFHPSHAMEHNPHRLEFRILLMYHFVDGFRALHDGQTPPQTTHYCCADKIRCLCCKPIPIRWDLPCSKWEDARRIAIRLKESCHCPEKDHKEAPRQSGFFAGEEPEEEEARKASTFDAMIYWLDLVYEKPQAFDFFGIADTMSFPKNNCKLNLAYKNIFSLLLRRKFGDKHWFYGEKNSSSPHLEDALSKLALSKCDNISDIRAESKIAYDSHSMVVSKLAELRAILNSKS